MIAALARRAMSEAEETFDFYVDAGAGNDVTGNRTKAAPYATLAKALSEAGAGQSIGLKDGTVQRPPTVATVQQQRLRLGRYGKGTAKPIVSGGRLVTGWAQQLTSPYQERVGSVGTASGTSHVAPVTSPVAAGNTALAVVKCSAGAAITGVVDSKGNAWTVDRRSVNASGATVALCRGVIATALTTADTITFTSSVACTTGIGVYEYAGTLTLDQSAAASGTGTTASAGPITTTSASEVVISAIGSGSTLAGSTPPASFTERDSGQKLIAADLAERVVSATGTFTPAWTITSGSWASVVASYTITSGGASDIYAAALTSPTSFVTSTEGGVTVTPLAKGASATALTAGQWFWAANVLYVNLGGVNPSARAIEAAVQNALLAQDKDGVVLRGIDFRHGYDREVYLQRCNYPRVDRCELRYCGYVANSGSLCLGWSSASPSVGGAAISRCVFDRLMNDGVWWSGLPGVVIEANRVTNLGFLPGDVQSDAFQVYLGFGSCAGFKVRGNYSDMTGVTGPKGHFACEGNPGHDLAGASCHDNVFIGGAYAFGGNASHIDVHDNVCVDQITGGGAMQVDATGGSSTGLRIFRNLIIRPAAAGLYVASGGPALVGFVLANNTVVDCSGIPLNVQPASLDASSVVANNLVWNPNAGPGANIVKAWPTSGNLPAGWDRNLYPADRANGWQFKGTNYATLAAFAAATGADVHSLQGQDPLLDADYVPGPGSPARNAGQVIAGITDGFLGAAPDLGYVEVG